MSTRSKNGTEDKSRRTRSVLYRPRAKLDVESAVIYLGQVQRQPRAAEQLYQKTKEAAAMLAQQPTIGRRYADKTLDQEQYCSWHIDNYRIFYTFGPTTLTIWRVAHTSKDIDELSFIEWE